MRGQKSFKLHKNGYTELNTSNIKVDTLNVVIDVTVFKLTINSYLQTKTRFIFKCPMIF